jgi:hypothetical protein
MLSRAHRAAHSKEANGTPLLEVITAGTQKQATRPEESAAVVEVLANENASGQQLQWSSTSIAAGNRQVTGKVHL